MSRVHAITIALFFGMIGCSSQAASDAPSVDFDATPAEDAGAEVLTLVDTCTSALTSVGPSGTCDTLVRSWNDEGFDHYAIGTVIDYCTDPPNSGPHYPIWPAFTTWTVPIPAEFRVHALEHGTIVFTYDCDPDCPDEVAALQAIIDAQPADPICANSGDGTKNRFILAPNPGQATPIEAAAWTWTLNASCVDTDAINAFITAHYGQGREAICGGGFAQQ